MNGLPGFKGGYFPTQRPADPIPQWWSEETGCLAGDYGDWLKWILLDEPTSGLDPDGQQRMKDLIQSWSLTGNGLSFLVTIWILCMKFVTTFTFLAGENLSGGDEARGL